MSHLLTRLADRALGIAPTIEPVRSPMFSRESPGYGEPAEHQASGFVFGDIVTGAQAAQPATGTTPAGPPDTAANHVEQGNPPDSLVQPVASRIVHEPSTTDENKPFARISNGQLQSQDSRNSSVLLGSPPSLTETVVADPAPHATALSPVASQASRTIDNHLAAPEQGPGTANVLSERQSSPDSPTQTSAASLLRPRDSTVLSFAAQPSAIDKLSHESKITQAQQPTIKVTIGRIEVRAVTTPPAQAPRQRQKTQASLSLDDYLKQRSGGQR